MNTFHYSTACRQILGDLYTPVSTYLKVRDLYPQSALMESSDYHSHDNSRSFIALNPIASIDISHGTVTAQYPDGTQESREINENYPAEQAFNDFLSRFTVTGDKQEFCGLYGYTSFNAVRYFEHIEIKDCMQEKNDAPDILYILYKYVIAFDHFNNTMTLIELVENRILSTNWNASSETTTSPPTISVPWVKPSARSRTMNIKPTSAKALPTAYGATCSKSY